MSRVIYQINLSSALGGAEVYSGTFTRALLARGWATHLITLRSASFWSRLALPESVQVPIERAEHALRVIPQGAILVIHAPLPRAVLAALQGRTTLIALAHQALYEARWPAYYELAHQVVPVSQHVIDTLTRYGFKAIWREPLYAAIDLARHSEAAGQVVRGPLCDWDSHKPRDRVMRRLAPLGTRLLRAVQGRNRFERRFERRSGLTLGIVSRLAPLKQFPLLFNRLSAALRAAPHVNIEVFGSAVDYRSLREFRAAVRPLGRRVRLWGHQSDVVRVYPCMDFLMTGLPEREALGPNVLEAQRCGTAVIAPRAAPFTETIVEGSGGFFYTDPREDGGADFARLLERLATPGFQPPDPLLDTDHLARFGVDAFADRVDRLMQSLVSSVAA